METCERILGVAAGLLVDIGVERISTNLIAPRLPGVPRAEIWPRGRLSVELSYAAIEMILEDDRADAAIVLREATAFAQAYLRD